MTLPANIPNLSIDDFLSQFSQEARRRIADVAVNNSLVAYRRPGYKGLSVQILDENNLPDDPVSVYYYDGMAKSRTQVAVELVEAGMSAYHAAREAGVSPSAVSRALAARKRGPRCPHCGQLLRNAQDAPETPEDPSTPTDA